MTRIISVHVSNLITQFSMDKSTTCIIFKNREMIKVAIIKNDMIVFTKVRATYVHF